MRPITLIEGLIERLARLCCGKRRTAAMNQEPPKRNATRPSRTRTALCAGETLGRSRQTSPLPPLP